MSFSLFPNMGIVLLSKLYSLHVKIQGCYSNTKENDFVDRAFDRRFEELDIPFLKNKQANI